MPFECQFNRTVEISTFLHGEQMCVHVQGRELTFNVGEGTSLKRTESQNAPHLPLYHNPPPQLFVSRGRRGPKCAGVWFHIASDCRDTDESSERTQNGDMKMLQMLYFFFS